MSAACLRAPATLALAALVLTGCGSNGSGAHSTAASRARSSTTAGRTGADGARGDGGSSSSPPSPPAIAGAITLPDPSPTGRPPASADLRVIRAWADTLRRGDVQGAARYFARPSEMINGPAADGRVSVVQIRSLADAVLANADLPCGARLKAADQRGVYINALFALTGRGGLGGGCQDTTGTGRVNFVIRGGEIVRWIRARDEPGDSAQVKAGGSGGGTSPPPTSTGKPNAPVV